MAKEIKVIMTLDTSGVESGLKRVESKLSDVKKNAKESGDALSTAFSVAFLAGATVKIVEYADAYQNLKNKLMAFSGGQEEANSKFKDITDIAKNTRSDVSAVGDLYTKLTITSKELGLSQGQVGKITETFSKALKVSGASAAGSASSILQFGQAMASGKLNGDEFKSLMENSPVFMRKMAEGLKVPLGDLKKLASEGKITSETMAAATLAMSKDIDEQFGKTTPTIGDALTQIRNSVVVLFGNIQESTGIFSKFAAAIEFVADHIRILVPVIGVALVSALGAATLAMRRFALANPFTAIAMAVGLLIGIMWDLVESTGSVSNAFKTIGNAGIAVVNMLLNGFAAYFEFVAGQFVTLGKVIVNALNPMSDKSSLDILKNGLSEAFNAAKRKLTGEGPIKFRFQLDPVTGKAAKPDVPGLGTPKLGKGDKDDKIDKGIATQMAAGQKIIDNIQNQIDLGQQKLTLDLASIGASDLSKKLGEAELKVEEDRKKAITDINALEKIGADARDNYIDSANIKFDELKTNTLAGLKQIDDAQKTFAFNKTIAAIGEQGAQTLKQFRQQQQLDRELSEAKRANLSETFAIENDITNQSIALRQKYKDLTDPAYLDELNKLEQIRLARLASVAPTQDARVTEEVRKQNDPREGVKSVVDQLLKGTTPFQVAADQTAALFNGMNSALDNFVTTGKFKFGDFARSIILDLIKIQLRAQATQLLSMALGSIFPGMSLPGKAAGGPVSAGSPYIVGEKGMELFIPRSAGTVVPNDQLSMMGNNGGNTSVNYTIQAVDAASFRQMLARDPEFIYNLTEQTRRSLPARRRQ